MFEKKQYIFSESMGVCRVEDITKLALKRGEPISYYVLRSVYKKDKTAYIPVEHHAVELRELISVKEAEKLLEDFKEPESQEELEDWQTGLLMEDTLPKEKRDLLYRRGEAEFVYKNKK